MHFHRRTTVVLCLAFMLTGSVAHGQNQYRPALPASEVGRSQSDQDRIDTAFIAVPAARFPTTQRQLASVFRGQLNRVQTEDDSTWELSAGGATSTALRLRFDNQRSGIHVTGPRQLIDQFSKLVNTLSAPPRDGYRTQVFRLQRQNHTALRGAVESIGNEKPRPLGVAKPVDQSRYLVPAGSLGSVRQAAFQDPAEAESNSGQPPKQPTADQAAEGLRQFDGVEIESLPELDVIILRGRDPDLAQLADVVEQLERISKETQPNIRIVPLQHAASEAVAEIISQTSEDLVGGRQGRVSVTPLVKPNALLLIGWGDAVQAIIQLARQLDTPVSPNTQSAVFRLRHALATDVGETVNEFLTGRTGLGPRVVVTVDPRTNSLIVYASPRDLQEVDRLIRELDQAGGSRCCAPACLRSAMRWPLIWLPPSKRRSANRGVPRRSKSTAATANGLSSRDPLTKSKSRRMLATTH